MYLTANFLEGLNGWFVEFTDKYLFKLLICIGVIIGFIILKYVLTAIATAIIKKTVKKAKNNDPERAEAIKKAVVPMLRILVMTAALAVCLPIISPPEGVAVIAKKVISSLFLVSVFAFLYGLVSYGKYFLEKRYKGKAEDSLAINFTIVVLKIVVIILGILTVLQQWVTNISSLLAGLSIGGVALALAAQDTAANLFGAVTVMFDKPFEAGDYIEVSGEAGTVERMGMRSTTLRRKDRSSVCIPNSKMATENIVNWSRTDARRVDMELSVLYSTSGEMLERFMKGIEEILDKDENVQKGKSLVAFDSFADSALVVSVRFLTYDKDYDGMMNVKNGINLRIMKLAESMNIGFAYPTRSIYLMNDEKKD